MHTTARYFIKTAFIFFALGIFAGIYLYAAPLFGWRLPTTLISAHTHILLVGGMMMMILGVAIWFFPRPTQDDTRYNPALVRTIYWFFAGSTLLRFILEIAVGLQVSRGLQLAGLTMALVQVASILGLIYTLWGRIRPVGSHLREGKGEKF